MRGGPSKRKKQRSGGAQQQYDDDDDFEQLDGTKFSGAEQKVAYSIEDRVTLAKQESCIVPMRDYKLPCKKVLVYDRSENELNAQEALHITNNSDKEILCYGKLSLSSQSNKFLGQSELMPMLPSDDQVIYIGEDTTLSVTFQRGRDQDVVQEVEYDQDERLR